MLRQAMQNQLMLMLRGLTAFQQNDSHRTDYGALYCPFHDCYHARCAEAAFPLVSAGLSIPDTDMLEKGLLLCDWLVSRQNQDGSWHETPDRWKGTTVFQLMALSAVVDCAGQRLSDDRRRGFGQAISKAATWVSRHVSIRAMTTNYVASGAAALALAHRTAPDQTDWSVTARRLARKAMSRINREGLIKGEGVSRRIFKIIRRPSNAIDIGYGLEMSLSALAIYAAVVADRHWSRKILFAIESHLAFIYPDGSLDNSLGSRGYKWTLLGSKTAHGSQPALVYASPSSPRARLALERIVRGMEGFLKDGLVTDGPYADGKLGLSCLYATVMRSAALALSLHYLDPLDLQDGEGSDISASTVTRFRSLNSHIVTHDQWKTTISGYGATSLCSETRPPEYYYTPGGGSVTYLLHRHWGAIQAATQLKYALIEPMHIPAVVSPPVSLTPRVALYTAQGTATSAHWRRPRISTLWEGDLPRLIVKTGFLLPEGKGKKMPDDLFLSYAWESSRIVKSFRLVLKERYPKVEIIEPLILPKEANPQAIDNQLVLTKGEYRLGVSAVVLCGPWKITPVLEPRYVPLPSLRSVCFICQLEEPGPGTYQVEVIFEISTGQNASAGEAQPCRV